ncbi:MAG: OmpA family protein [Betaproteobacteria bacterium]|nr:OmpA family protein [Betaproteobacteria bacterium]
MSLKLSIYASLSAVVLSFGIAPVQADVDLPGYWTDQRGEVVRNGQGLCWRTQYWTPARATEACDPDLMPKPVAIVTPPQPVAPMPARAEPAPAPVAPIAVAPVVAPAIVPAPAPRREKVALSADALFTFGKADLRPTAMEKLDDLVGKLKGVDPESIHVTGHTDRLGSSAYNQRLSMQRAESIKSYLVSRGVAPSEIEVAGKGELESVTRPNECTGPKGPKLIACLQADRRVEIELVGTRLR